MALTSNEIAELKRVHPAWQISEDGTEIKGVLSFEAAYEKDGKSFTPIYSPVETPVGIRLKGAYPILILDPAALPRKKLPGLYIDDPDCPRSLDRHFYPDGQACVAGPSEEALMVGDDYSFENYLNEQVVPFLYAQRYYDEHSEWPLGEYSHGLLGVLESYYQSGEVKTISVTIGQLRRYKTGEWKMLLPLLKSKQLPKGHMRCFCEKRDYIRRCHTEAWYGLRKLYADIQRTNYDLLS